MIIEKELKVYLYKGDKTLVKTALRLIIAKQKESNQTILFVTNISDLKVEDVCNGDPNKLNKIKHFKGFGQ